MVLELKQEFITRTSIVRETLIKYINDNNFDFSDTVIENLSIHLSLCITREINGTYIPTSDSYVASLKDSDGYKTAVEFTKELNQIFDISLDESETNYIAVYFSNLSVLDDDLEIQLDLVDADIELMMAETLAAIKSEMNLDLSNNKDFTRGMSLHFYPAIERLRTDKQLINNPLINHIAAENETEYKCAKILNDVVFNHYNKRFNEHELAYITLHFGTALR